MEEMRVQIGEKAQEDRVEIRKLEIDGHKAMAEEKKSMAEAMNRFAAMEKDKYSFKIQNYSNVPGTVPGIVSTTLRAHCASCRS